MTADKMPKMPPAPVTDAVLGPLYSRHDLQAYGRACYLAGIEAAKACVPNFQTPMEDERDDLSFGFNRCREATLTNLNALEQEAKK